LAGLGKDSDLFTAIHAAAEHLEKQAVKARTKWRDTKRTRRAVDAALPKPEATPRETEAERQVFRVNHRDARKPMTLDEAILEMEPSRDYMVYRDAESDRISVLVRRKDGHFDLVEG
jgi:putative sigma-54 modulation protein